MKKIFYFISIIGLIFTNYTSYAVKLIQTVSASDKFVHGKETIVKTGTDVLLILSYSGLQFYRSESDNTIIKTNKFALGGIPASVIKIDSFLYIALQGGYDKIYKISLEDSMTPKTIDSIQVKGSYVNFTSNDRLFINELKFDNTWTLHNYDKNFNFLSSIDVPHKYWPINKLNDTIFYIQKYDTLKLYKFSDSILKFINEIKIDSISYPCDFKLIGDTTLIACSNTCKTKVFGITKSNSWELKFQLPKSESINYFDNSIYLKSDNQIYIYSYLKNYTLQLRDLISIDSKICSFSVENSGLILTSADNQLYKYKRQASRYQLNNKTLSPPPIIKSIFHDNVLVVENSKQEIKSYEIIDNKLFHLQSLKTHGSCLALSTCERFVQRICHSSQSNKINSQFYYINPNTLKLERGQDHKFRGNIALMNKDTLLSFYEGILYIYEMIDRSIILKDSIEMKEPRFGLLSIEGRNIIILSQKYLFRYKLKNNAQILFVEKIPHLYTIPYSIILDELIFVSDLMCRSNISSYKINEPLKFMGSSLSTGHISTIRNDSLLISGCKNHVILEEYKNIEKDGIQLFDHITTTDYSNLIGLHTYSEGDNHLIIIVKETGIYLYKL